MRRDLHRPLVLILEHGPAGVELMTSCMTAPKGLGLGLGLMFLRVQFSVCYEELPCSYFIAQYVNYDIVLFQFISLIW